MLELDLRGVGGDLGNEDGGRGVDDVRHFAIGSVDRIEVLSMAMGGFERPFGISIVGWLDGGAVGFVRGL